MTFLGLPLLTAIFIFGVPALSVILSVVFARVFRADTEEWFVFDLKRTEKIPGLSGERATGQPTREADRG